MKSNFFLMNTFGDVSGGGGGQEPGEVEQDGGQQHAQQVNGEAAAQPQSVQLPENWKEALPAEIRGEKALESIKDVQSLAKSYLHAQKMVGQNKAIVPDPKLATNEDWKNFFVKAGLPEKPEEYKIDVKDPDQLPEKFLDTYQQKAHELNILPHQAKELLEWYRDYDSQVVEQMTEQQQQDMQRNLDAYRQEVGQAYDRKIALADKVINEFGDEKVSQLIVESGMAKNPDFIKLISQIGEKMFGEDKILGDGNEEKRNALTPDEAREKWGEIRADKEHPYWRANHPNHQTAVKEVQKLMSYMV